MELDLYCTEPHPARIGAIAGQAQAAGFAGLWVTEAAHNPFIACALAAEAADNIVLGTDVAIAFPRSPMVTAQAAWDLAALSGGRFILGLGTQVKAHLERRFSVSGERPAARVREYILALRAIFDAFAKRAPLRFEGEFWRFSLLTEFFAPAPLEVPDPPIYLAGVNERLATVTGEVADDLVDAFSVTATWDGLADALLARFTGVADRIFPYHVPDLADPAVAERWRAVAAAVARG